MTKHYPNNYPTFEEVLKLTKLRDIRYFLTMCVGTFYFDEEDKAVPVDNPFELVQSSYIPYDTDRRIFTVSKVYRYRERYLRLKYLMGEEGCSIKEVFPYKRSVIAFREGE
jgi:hypothetical protein